MSDENISKPKTKEEKTQDFIKAYQDLCNKHGLKINVSPIFKARDDGTWSVVLQSSVDVLNVGNNIN